MLTGKPVAKLWPFLYIQDGMAISRHLGFYWTANSAIRSANPENDGLKPNTE